MSKIYLLKDFGDINNGFYAGNKYIDPEDGERGAGYEVYEMEGFNASQDVRVEERVIC